MTQAVITRSLGEWGTLYSPPGDGPFPAILVLHGSEGGLAGWSHRNAAVFAASGFAALPIIYSSSSSYWHAGDIVDVPLDRTVEAMAELRNSKLTTGTVGIYGVSRGAEHALLVASLMSKDGNAPLPDAVAVHSPPDVVCGGFRGDSMRHWSDPIRLPWDPALRSWTWHGSQEGLKPTDPIEIETYPGPLFLSHGEADQVWGVDCTRRLERRLRQAGREPQVCYYSDQDHGFDPEAETRHYAEVLSFFETTLE